MVGAGQCLAGCLQQTLMQPLPAPLLYGALSQGLLPQGGLNPQFPPGIQGSRLAASGDVLAACALCACDSSLRCHLQDARLGTAGAKAAQARGQGSGRGGVGWRRGPQGQAHWSSAAVMGETAPSSVGGGQKRMLAPRRDLGTQAEGSGPDWH